MGIAGWAAQTVISRGFYALGSTWLPTILGTTVAVVAAPLYVVLRQRFGANGLATASAAAILAYVLLLGWLQRRRFEREAAAKGVALKDESGMLDGALRLATAAAIATGAGLAARAYLLQFLPGMHLGPVLMRATALCTIGGGIYVIVAWLLGMHEITEIADMLLHKLGLRRRT